MSKQTTANEIYANSYSGLSRKDIIQRIVDELSVSSAYASTLYNNAKKANVTAQNDRTASMSKPLEIKPTELPKIERFDRPTLRMFRSELENALEEVQEKFGVTIDLGSMRFSNTDFTARISVALGSADEAAQRDWEKNCIFFGLDKNDFGRTFTDRGTRFTVTGIKPRSRKYPILATNANGTTYKFPASKLK